MRIDINNIKKRVVKTVMCNIDSKHIELNSLHLVAENDDEVIRVVFTRAETSLINDFLKSNGGG